MTKGSKNHGKFYQSATRLLKRINHRYAIAALLLMLLVSACAQTSESDLPSNNKPASNSKVLKIWWDKGYTLEEDEALQQVVKQWEKQTGNEVDLSFYTNDELSLKAERALQAGQPPDILMNDSAERVLNPRLAWEGKLVDVSDVLEPHKQFYPDTILKNVFLYNKLEEQHSYYAIPIYQGIPLIFYWRDLIKKAGWSSQDIPQDWDAFWLFWQKVQTTLRTKDHQNIYGIGLPISVGASDTYEIFEQILEAYNVQILNSQNQLDVDNPQVRQGIIDCIDWYTQFYKQRYVPPEAVKWLNPDNNRSLLNRLIVMTPNNSLSIPAAVRQDLEIYRHKLGTIEYPNKPNGQPMFYLALVRQAVIFTESDNQKLAKEFLAYFIQPQITGKYLKAAGGRHLPVHKLVWQDRFWTDPTDPHISTAAQPFLKGQTRLFYTARNPAYSLVLKENLWGKILSKVVVEKISSEQAADEAIEELKQLFAQWPKER